MATPKKGKKRPANWRNSNQITAEVQADLRRKGITINSHRTLGIPWGNVPANILCPRGNE